MRNGWYDRRHLLVVVVVFLELVVNMERTWSHVRSRQQRRREAAKNAVMFISFIRSTHKEPTGACITQAVIRYHQSFIEHNYNGR